MSLIGLVVALVLIGLVLYLVETYIPMAEPIKVVIRVVVVLVIILWILQAFFGMGLPGVRLHAMEAETCFSKGEKVDGLNKICYYNCPSGELAVTVKSYQLCPVSIKH